LLLKKRKKSVRSQSEEVEKRERETYLVPLGYARQPYMGKENQYPV